MQAKIISVREIVTKSKLPDADYVINPYIGCPHACIYCYAEFMKRFTNHTEAWGKFIDVKDFNREINLKKIAGKSVLISSVTDPYNPFEAKYKITQKILKQLIHSEARIELLTKSKLLLRDIDIIRQLKYIRIGISLNTLDDKIRKQMEPYTSSVKDRLAMLQVIHQAEIPAYVFLSPMFPGITDFKEIILATKDLNLTYCFENLNLRGSYKKVILEWISNNHPQLYPLYEEIYIKKNNDYWEKLKNEIEKYCQSGQLNYKLYFYHELIKK